MSVLFLLLGTVGAWWAARRVAHALRLRPVRVATPTSRSAAVAVWWAGVLTDAGIVTAPDTVAVWWCGAVGAGGVFGGLVDARLGVLAAGGVVGGGVAVLATARQRSRAAAVRALPGFVRTVAAELRIGGTVVGAIERGAVAGPLAPDCRRIATRLRLGAPVLTALSWWPTDRDGPDVRAVAGALAVAASVGGPAADALDGLAAALADRHAVVAEARAQSAQARSSAVVVVAAPLGYLVVAAAADQRAIDALFATPIGVTCLVVAIVLELVAVWWIRSLLRRATSIASGAL